MAAYSKHHHVPQFYMQNFASREKKFNIHNFKKSKTILDVPFKGQCQIKYFYGRNKDKDWEKKLSQYETTWASTIRGVIEKGNKFIINSDVKKVLCTFAVFQNLRSTKARDSIIDKNWETLKIGMNMSNKVINPNNEDNLKKHYINWHEDIASDLLDVAEKIFEYMNDLEVKIIQYDTKQSLISSDNPIIYQNYIYPSIGLKIAGLIIFFPVGCHHLIVIYDSKIYRNSEIYQISNNEDEVRKLNQYQLIVASDLIFGLDNFTFNKIEKLKVMIKINREYYWKSALSVSAFGPDEQKIIQYTQPMIRDMSTHSFSRLTSLGLRMIQVKLNNRDWFPRTDYITKEYQERMEIRVKLFSSDPLMLTYCDVKEIQKYNELIETYWKLTT